MLLVCVCACSASADLRVGFLARVDNEKFQEISANFYDPSSSIFSERHQKGATYVFFESMHAMILALNSGAIDELDTFAVTARYILETSDAYKISCIDYNDWPLYFSFGLMKGKGEALRDKMNEA